MDFNKIQNRKKIYCYLINDSTMSNSGTKLLYINTEHQLVELTKPLFPTQFHHLIGKMGLSKTLNVSVIIVYILKHKSLDQ